MNAATPPDHGAHSRSPANQVVSNFDCGLRRKSESECGIPKKESPCSVRGKRGASVWTIGDLAEALCRILYSLQPIRSIASHYVIHRNLTVEILTLLKRGQAA